MRQAEGAPPPAQALPQLRRAHRHARIRTRRCVSCAHAGPRTRTRSTLCDICGNTVDLKLKYAVDECQERGMTYAVPLKVTIRLVV